MEPSTAYQAGEAFGRYAVMAIIAFAFLGGGGFFIFAVIKAFTRKTGGWIAAAVVSGILALAGFLGVIGLVGNAVSKGMQSAKATGERKKRVTGSDGAYQISVPGRWKEMPEINAEAGIITGDMVREQYVMIIRNPKTDFTGDLMEFDTLVGESLLANLSASAISGQTSRVVAGYPARQSRITGSADNIGLVYLMFSVETADAFYQILCWTLPSRELTALPVFQEIIETFHATAGAPLAKVEGPIIDPADTLGRITAITAELLNAAPSEIKPQHRFIEDLGADSLDTVELVMAVEEEFDVSIDDESATKIRTVGELVEWVENQRKPE